MHNVALNFREKRRETCKSAGFYHNIEFSAGRFDPLYQFNLWNLSPRGICFLVKEGSPLIGKLKAGDRLNMKFNRFDGEGPSERMQAEIRHVTEKREGRFKGHVLVGLRILAKQ